ncbi:hypothetical protein JTB14_032829 [Gonioctena quinquepunctata]|nr:hypothetical protein JTB14_032829 [Gonioctena quinquepunctata]
MFIVLRSQVAYPVYAKDSPELTDHIYPISPSGDGPLQVDAISSSCDNDDYDPYDVGIIMGVPYWNIPMAEFVEVSVDSDSESDTESEETIQLDEQEPIDIDLDEGGLWIDLPPDELDELAEIEL